MSFEERKKQYNKIEKIRKRPLIVYITSSRSNAGGSISTDVVPQFIKQLNQINRAEKALDILVVSNGGDPTVPWRIISMIRERFDNVGALLPYAAYSAATLLALGADEIIMHPNANLGPVDPQLTYKKKDGELIHFGTEDLSNYINFVREDVGLSDQEQMERAFELICKDVGAIPIGVAKRSAQLALSMGEKLLSLHMEDKSKVKAISENLNKSYFHHGYPLGRKEAKDIGLPVIIPDEEVEGLMWDVWENVELEMECNKPFDHLEIAYDNESVANMLDNIHHVQIPENLPQELKEKVYQQVISQINIAKVEPVEFESLHAVLESTKCRSEFRTKGKIFVTRKPDMSINLNVIKTKQGWHHYCE